MEINNKKLERTSKIIHYSISGLLCLFLILLSARIIDDLDMAVSSPAPSDFEDKEAMSVIRRGIKSDSLRLEALDRQVETVNSTIAVANNNYNDEKESFENWLKARPTLASPVKDPEVVKRAENLDEYYQVTQLWRAQMDSLQLLRQEANRTYLALLYDADGLTDVAYKRYQEKLKGYELKVFMVRLLFVAPVLFLGIYFFIRFRRHRFWPLFFGFSLFSIYAFFFGLVPYLPSYGGYVRYSMGILLTVGLGYYAISRLRIYMEQKQQELKVSSHERARQVLYQVAEKALDNHFCPSCGKDFVLRKWEFPANSAKEGDVYRFVTNFCRHCGLELFKNCESCGTKNFAHLKFCSSCGSQVSRS